MSEGKPGREQDAPAFQKVVKRLLNTPPQPHKPKPAPTKDKAVGRGRMRKGKAGK